MQRRSSHLLADAVAVFAAAEAVRTIRQIDVHGLASWVAIEQFKS